MNFLKNQNYVTLQLQLQLQHKLNENIFYCFNYFRAIFVCIVDFYHVSTIPFF